MTKYEIIYIIDSGLSEEDIKSAVEKFTGFMGWYLRSIGSNDLTLNASKSLYLHSQQSRVSFLGNIDAGGLPPKVLNEGIRPAILINKP